MIKNKILSYILKVFIIIIGSYGVFLNVYTNNTFNIGVCRYYTILSNILCIIFIIITLIKMIKKDKLSNNFYRVKTCVTFCITVTFLVYHFLLRKQFAMVDASAYSSVANTIVHYIVPICMILDNILFDDKTTYKKYEPILWLIIPIIYFILSCIFAYILPPFEYASSRYPYYFIDIDNLGIFKVLLNVLLLCGAFTFLGYIYYFFKKITYLRK